ncbi:GatB/YqeY domain-containing protein [Acidaminobacter hydrogenoformans]|uniref:GatB/YqeY domain-containing protein n=1 Tax=Acidaminobacter hydrogenoformans DSM 2784 TaxID=1120920 RepID=A0A1G5RTI7_9FIRM|nr:GatB/YqeY domain-containing protein [Acidaminobacter hydrogenoformans]SCZ77158.1 hypothetical protein SAMN03080599_00603 [Acidaminobacter hydrogenoformans DSM 2784]
MSLKDLLMQDLKAAMQEKDVLKKTTVTMLRAAVKQVEVDQRIELQDQDIVEIVAKQIKQKRAAIEEFSKGGRQDLVDEALAEIHILEAYLPEQLTEEQIKTMILEAIAETGASTPKDMGKVMGIMTPKTKGLADGKLVATLVKEHLNQ